MQLILSEFTFRFHTLGFSTPFCLRLLLGDRLARDAAVLAPLHLPSLNGRARAQVSCRRFTEALHVLKVAAICAHVRNGEEAAIVETLSHIIMSSGRGQNILTFVSIFWGVCVSAG